MQKNACNVNLYSVGSYVQISFHLNSPQPEGRAKDVICSFRLSALSLEACYTISLCYDGTQTSQPARKNNLCFGFILPRFDSVALQLSR